MMKYIDAMKRITRRDFIKGVSSTIVASRAQFDLGLFNSASETLVTRVHDSNASKPWDYGASAPWDWTVEPVNVEDMKSVRFRKDRYFNHINEEIVDKMFKRGLNEIAGTEKTRDAWRKILGNHAKGDKITIKINMNNASYDERITTNRMDQTAPLVNAIISDLTESFSVPEENITVADPSRWIHPEIIIRRCNFNKVKWVDSRTPDLWDKSESVKFTKDNPVKPDMSNFKGEASFSLPKVYTGADHIINVCLLKNHGCGITGAMKNHFGAIQPPSPKFLHQGLGEKSYIADLCNTESIRNKVRLNICDAVFANWHDNVWSPRPWNTFQNKTPNSLFFGTDPVAFDSVLLQHVTDEVMAQGDGAPEWVREAVGKHQFLHYAMEYHGLGIHEHKPFTKIDYRQVNIG